MTRDGWMRPAQKDVLAGVLKYHVVPGRLTAADLDAQIKAAGGKAVLKTADGQDLTASKSGDIRDHLERAPSTAAPRGAHGAARARHHVMMRIVTARL